MALEKGSVELPLGTGIDESTQREVLDGASAMAYVENLVSDKRGSFAKRRGLAALPRDIVDGGEVSAGHSLHEYDERGPVLVADDRLYDWSQRENAWVDRGRVPEATVARGSGAQSSARSTPFGYESVVYGGCRLFVYTVPLGANSGLSSYDSNETNFSDLYAQVLDAETGAVLLPATRLARIWGPAHATNFTVAVVAGRAVVTGLEVIGIPVTSWRLHAWVFRSTLPTTAPFDFTLATHHEWVSWMFVAVAQQPRGNELIYLHGNGATNRWTRLDVTTMATSAGAAPSLGTVHGDGILRSLALTYDTALEERVCVVWLENIGGGTIRWRAQLFTPAFAPLSPKHDIGLGDSDGGTHSVAACVGSVTTGDAPDTWAMVSRNILGFDNPFQSRITPTRVVQTRTSPGVWALSSSNDSERAGLCAYSEPINRRGRWYQWVQPTPFEKNQSVRDGGAMPYAMLVEIVWGSRSLRPVANVAPGLVSERSFPFTPHRVQWEGGADFVHDVPLLVRRNATTNHIEVARVDFDDDSRMRSAQFGDVLAFGGGCPVGFDGDVVQEIGFSYPPSIVAADVAYDSGRDREHVGDGTYSIFAVWERTDARGNVHRSEMSNIVTLTLSSGGNRVFLVRANPLSVTYSKGLTTPNGAADSNVRMVVYRTDANMQTFYRADDMPACVPSVTLEMRTAGNRNQLFYSQPGVPGSARLRYAPPSLRGMIMHHGALAGIADDGRTIWFSGAHLPGEGPWFNPGFIAYIDDVSAVLALASMDGRLYAFTRRNIWAIDGEGFADNGDGGFGLPYRVPCDAGCANERSIIVTPIGVLFQSDRGISLLSRTGEVTPFGRAVEDTLARYPDITSATLSPDASDVRFTCNGDAGSIILAWDWRDNIWTVFRSDALSSPWVHSAPILRASSPRWHGLCADGTVLREDGYGDRGSAIPSRFESAWIKVAGIQGFQRVWRVLLLAHRIGRTALTVRLRYDYDETDVEVRTWTMDEMDALPSGTIEVHCKRQKCSALKVVVEDAPVSPTPGLVYVGLRTIVGIKGKTPRGPVHR